MPARRPWTATEHAEALALRAAGLTHAAIATRLGRTQKSVEDHLLASARRRAPTKRLTCDDLAGLEAVTVVRFLAIPTPRGVCGRFTWRAA